MNLVELHEGDCDFGKEALAVALLSFPVLQTADAS